MHEPSLLHVRDHSKVTGPAHHMLEYIAQHVNKYTGEAFQLTVDRLAYRLQVTPQWVGQLRRQLVEAGELLVQQSRGRHPNVYVIPYARCHLCQGATPDRPSRGEDFNPKVGLGVDDPNPKRTPNQPQTNPKVVEASGPDPARIEPPKVLKELKEKKDRPTPKWTDEEPKAEEASPFWCAACGYSAPTCAHRVLAVVRSTPTGAVLQVEPGGGRVRQASPADPITESLSTNSSEMIKIDKSEGGG